MSPSPRTTLPASRSAELHNDAGHDSTVDTDGKNREAARHASGTISPDQITTSNASLVNAMPETPDGFAGFDSREGGNHPRVALRAGYMVIDKGFDAAPPGRPEDDEPAYRPRGREHWPSHPRRPARIFELAPIPR
ncbi:DUF3005 domain-containing protein [Burkholderia alba]|uniref:DUF3005 domain-containing protein n=1 Tax=Burkholderia alba TaxID=2683677 RepID=UPI002B05404E|nr:DUF3005 domain-containing protein [Burkholderia alba]